MKSFMLKLVRVPFKGKETVEYAARHCHVEATHYNTGANVMKR